MLSLYVTDGSYKIQTRSYLDILTSEHLLRDQGTGAAGIVFISSALDRAPLPHTVRIVTQDSHPGMSAYAWELIAQIVALQLTKFHPYDINAYSDCTATIARMNTALSQFTDQQAHQTAGILTSSAHMLSHPVYPRRIQHVKAHPERDAVRMANLTQLDKAIFLADAIAGATPARLNHTFINHVPHTVILEDIMSEIIPVYTWHLRQTQHMDIPVLDLPWTYQHHFQLRKYLANRDQCATSPSSYWQTTATDFMNAVHPVSRHKHHVFFGDQSDSLTG